VAKHPPIEGTSATSTNGSKTSTSEDQAK